MTTRNDDADRMTTRTRELDLLDRLWRITDASRLHCDAIMQDLMELSLPQFLALRTLGETRTSPTPTYVARTLGCSRANASELLTALEKKRCLARHRDAHDGRRLWLNLTLRGGDDVARGEGQLVEEAVMIFEPLDDDEKELLHELLRKITFPRE